MPSAMQLVLRDGTTVACAQPDERHASSLNAEMNSGDLSVPLLKYGGDSAIRE